MKLSTFELGPLQLPVCGLDVGKSRRPGMAGSSHNNFSYCSSRNVTSLTSEHSLEHWTSTSGSKMFGLRLLCSAKKGAKSCRKDLQIAASMVGYREAPSCIFVGPIETAEKARLEALYQQARDSYYSGQPLIVDDMFDKVETQLRWHGSKLVLKYPRCSLKRFSAYADAEVDPSQMQALAAIWSVLLTAGVALAVGLPACTLSNACEAVLNAQVESHHVRVLSDSNRVLAMVTGFLIGAPVAKAAVKQLQGLWRGDLVALKGSCPNCGEEVYTFIRADESMKPRHETECHVCERRLVFHANIQRSKSGARQPWAYGRVYLVTKANQLAPDLKRQ